MQAQFQLLCFLVMIPMLFSVPWLAANRFSRQQVARNLAVAGLGIAAASVAWLLGGYSLAFHQEVISDPLPVLVQLEFALYALVMLLGTALAARRTLFFPLFAALWLLLVYVPVANLLWGNGWLAKLGALDFSGGLVVHLTAGLTSLVLVRHLRVQLPILIAEQPGTTALGTVLILTGWFGFNLAPAGSFLPHGPLIMLNTVVAVLTAGLAWAVAAPGQALVDRLCNGINTGLVTSTALVGFVGPQTMAVTGLVAGLIAAQLVERYHQAWQDPVDSLQINTTGALVGVGGLILGFDPHLVPAGTTHLALAGSELTAVGVVVLITLVGSQVALWLSEGCLHAYQRIRGVNINVRSEEN